jgi:DNA-binding MarR family transcriptional regulator
MTAQMTTADTTRGPAGAGADLVGQLAELLVCASWRLRRTARAELEPFGLPFGQARALRLLSHAGEPLRIGELAARLEIVPRSATTMVDALEAAALVSRRPDPLDRRSTLVCLTATGDELVARLGRARRASAEALFSRLDRPQAEQLRDLLAALLERGPAPTAAPPADGAPS